MMDVSTYCIYLGRGSVRCYVSVNIGWLISMVVYRFIACIVCLVRVDGSTGVLEKMIVYTNQHDGLLYYLLCRSRVEHYLASQLTRKTIAVGAYRLVWHSS